MEQSQLRVISIGYVAENKARSTREVEISLVEALPFIHGEIDSNLVQETVDCKSSNGDSLSFSVYTSNTIRAKWMGDGTNRVSSPDVRRGDKVEVLQYGDTDQYFWRAYNDPNAPNVRKLETVVTAYSNTKDETQNEPNPDNSWIHEVNTHEKTVTFKTNKADGEPFAYTTQIDAKSGNVVVADDIGNYIQMNSKDQHIELETAAGGRIEIKMEDIIMTCLNFTLNAKENITVNGKKAMVTVPTTEWEGNIAQKGNYSLQGDMTGKAGGTYTFNGNVVTQGGITNNGKNIGAEHTHKGVQSGSGSTQGVS